MKDLGEVRFWSTPKIGNTLNRREALVMQSGMIPRVSKQKPLRLHSGWLRVTGNHNCFLIASRRSIARPIVIDMISSRIAAMMPTGIAQGESQ